MAKISPLKTAGKMAPANEFEALLDKPFKPTAKTLAKVEPPAKHVAGRLAEPKPAGKTVVVTATSEQPGSGEIRRMVEAGESLPTDLKGLVKVSDAIRAGASASAVKPFILSMGNKRKRQVLADGGSVHRRLKGTGYDGANRKGQFQKGRGKGGKAGSKAESASAGTGGEISTKPTQAKDLSVGPEPGSKGTLGSRRAPQGAQSANPAPATEVKNASPSKPLPAYGPKKGQAAPRDDEGGGVVGGAVGKMAGKVAGKAVKGAAAKVGGALLRKGGEAWEMAKATGPGQVVVMAGGGAFSSVSDFRKAVKEKRFDRAVAIAGEYYVPGAKAWISAMRFFDEELEKK